MFQRILFGASLYFVTLFAAGFLAGPIRILLLEPRLGKPLAVLIEAPYMLAVIFWAAPRIVRHFQLCASRFGRAGMGCLAFIFLITAECITAQWVRGFTIEEYLASYATAEGFISASLQLVFALAPLFVRTRSPHTFPQK